METEEYPICTNCAVFLAKASNGQCHFCNRKVIYTEETYFDDHVAPSGDILPSEASVDSFGVE